MEIKMKDQVILLQMLGGFDFFFSVIFCFAFIYDVLEI